MRWITGGIQMRKLFGMAIILGIFVAVFMFGSNPAEANATNSNRSNDRKFFTTYVVEKDDTLWDIAEEYMTSEYETIYMYIDEVMESNHLESTNIKCGQLLILPYYADAPVTK